MKTPVVLASIAVFSLLTSTAFADEPDMVKPSTRHAHSTGVALTITGASFLGTGVVAGVGSLLLAFTPSATNSDTGGTGLIFAVLGGMVAAGCTVVGLSTLIPGIVLMNNNRLPRPVAPPPLDAHQKAPAFTTIPIFSGTF